MSTEIGTYTVEDAFYITDRGWALVGVLTGQVLSGNHLLFPGGLGNIRNQSEKRGLMIPPQFATRQELLDQQIIGATARVLE